MRQTGDPLLMPTCHERRTGSDAAGTGAGLVLHGLVGDDTTQQTPFISFTRPEDAAFEQDFQQ